MKIEIGQHYLIRQTYQYGADKHDDIMVVKCRRKATALENMDYASDAKADGYIGEDIRGEGHLGDKYFEPDEVIAPYRV